MMPGWVLEPDQKYTVTSRFGYRTDPHGSGATKFHSGVDIAVPEGTRILAMEGGRVEESGFSNSAGFFVRIHHEGEFYSEYFHMKEMPQVRIGDMVDKGALIGFAGSTGSSTGNHLHFNVYEGDRYIDPVAFLNGNIEYDPRGPKNMVVASRREEKHDESGKFKTAGTSSAPVAFGFGVLIFLAILSQVESK